MLRKVCLLAALILGVLLSSPSFSLAQTNVSGTISSNTTWTLAPSTGNNGSPYIVTGGITLNAALTIEAGVQVKFNGNYSITVNGTLISQGSSSQPVTFTSNQSTPAPGDWNSIIVNSGGNTLDYLVVEYAAVGITLPGFTTETVDHSTFQNNNTGVSVNAGSHTVRNSTFQNNNRGIYTHIGVSPTITQNTIANNVDGVYVNCTFQGGCSPAINNNSIYSNTGYNVNVAGNGNRWIIDARNNWWGSQNITAILAGINDYLDNSSLPTVDAAPYLNAPSGNPIGDAYLYGNTSGTLQPGFNPYLVVGNMIVVGTLTVQAGVEVRFTGNYSLTVFGNLTAAGSSSQLIKFTSGQSTPAKGDWGGLVFNNGGNTLDYLQVEYAVTGITIGGAVSQSVSNSTISNNTNGIVVSDNGSGNIQNNTIQNNDKGIYSVLGASPNITGNTVTNNIDGIYVHCEFQNGCNPVINNNAIHSNTGYNVNVFNNGSSFWVIINAENNWWGSQNVANVMAGIYDYADNANRATVDPFPYLDAPSGNPIGQGYMYGAQNGTILQSNSPYTVVGNMIITGFGNVTVQPGVEFRFDGNYRLHVDGVLNAAGTSGQPIKFTSNQTTPAAGDWDRVTLVNGSGTIDYWQVEYSDAGLHLGSYGITETVQNSLFQYNNTGVTLGLALDIDLQNNTITNNMTGVYSNSLIKLTAAGNTVTNNTDGFLLLCGEAVCDVRVNNNAIHSNTGYNVKVQNLFPYRVPWMVYDFENNWWNSTSATAIAATIWDNADDPALPPVDFDPFLPSASGQPLVSNVSVTPQFFDPFSTQTTVINYTIGIDSNVTIKIFEHSSGNLVRTLINAAPRLAGARMETWDGKDGSNQLLPPGAYYFTIDAVTAQNVPGGYSPVYWVYPVPITGGSISTANFNPYIGETATVTYTLQSPAIMTLRVGVPQAAGPQKTMALYDPRQTLQNTDVWDGRNDAGDIVPRENFYQYSVWGWAEPLRENGIYIQHPGLKIDYVTVNQHAIYPLYGQVSEIKYRINQSATVSVTVEDPSNTIVRTLVNSQPQAAAEYTLQWDGKDSSGNIVDTAGHYKVKVSAVHASGAVEATSRGNITVFE